MSSQELEPPSDIDASRQEEATLHRQLAAVRRSVAELRGELGLELARFCRADALLDASDLVRELRRARSQLLELERSPSYRLGSALLEPARLLRDVGRRLRVRLRPAPLAPPRPVKDESKYARLGAYHWGYLDSHPWYVLRQTAVSDWAPPGGTCLDLGCGDGAIAHRVGARTRRVVGIDLDPRAIEKGREELARRGATNVDLRLGRLQDAATLLGDERFDLVYSLDCIEHLLEPRELVEVMHRACRPGGVVIVGTPLYLSEAAFSPYHVRELTLAQLDALLVPRFFKVGTSLLPAPRPDDPHRLDARYALWVGRRRRGLFRPR